MFRYIIHFDGPSPIYTNDSVWLLMTDAQLANLQVTCIDRWSDALDDYVEARRVF